MEKEKRTQEIRVLVEPSLYAKFRQQCETEYKTVSEAVRDLMRQFLKGGE